MVRVARVLAVVIAVPTLGTAHAAADITLVLRERVVVERDHVSLGDVAEVRTEDAELKRILSAVELGGASIHSARLYSRTAMTTLLKPHVDVALIFWDGAHRVSVNRKSDTLGGDVLVSTAREYLSRTLRERDPSLTRLEIDAEVLEAVRVPTGSVTVTPKSVQGTTRSKRMCVWLDIEVNGEVHKHMPVWMNVSAYKQVHVTARALAAREAVVGADFTLEERDVSGFIGDTLPTPSVAGLRVRRALPAGTVARTGDFEAQPAVARNQEVDVRVTIGSIQLETKAVAEQDGKIGDWIKLRNPSSNESFVARIVQAGLVWVSGR
jgi:flagella basal body P-ring formation protein FlgA